MELFCTDEETESWIYFRQQMSGKTKRKHDRLLSRGVQVRLREIGGIEGSREEEREMERVAIFFFRNEN